MRQFEEDYDFGLLPCNTALTGNISSATAIRKILNEPNHVKYCMRNTSYNKPCEPLDCNRGRSSLFRKTPQNYIFIERD